MKQDEILAQIDSALLKYRDHVAAVNRKEPTSTVETKSALMTTLERLCQPGSYYLREANVLNKTSISTLSTLGSLASLLRALRSDVVAGYSQNITQLVRADTFADFLAMADHLLSEGYKDPAAVLAGSVLEQHLRALAASHAVETETADGRPVKADKINSDLAKESAYSKLEQKSVTAWLGLRNEAAHGHFDKYAAPNVRLMIDGVTLFISQHPN